MELLIGSLDGQFGVGSPQSCSVYAHGNYRREVCWAWFDTALEAQDMLDAVTKMQARVGVKVVTRVVNGNVAWVRG